MRSSRSSSWTARFTCTRPVAAAQAGEHIGGSGCVVAVPLHNDPDTDVATVYAVTNSHVVRSEQGGSTVVRVNRKDGGFDALPLDPDSWIHHGDGADIAVAPMTLDEGTHRYTSIGPWTFVTPEQPMWFGVGADTVMVGRFVTHEGRQRNIPAARFGNVSVLPYEPVRVGLGGLAQERFLVEEHSFSGYSGSPVFVYHQLLPEDVPTVDPDARALEQPPYLMGMACRGRTWKLCGAVLRRGSAATRRQRWRLWLLASKSTSLARGLVRRSFTVTREFAKPSMDSTVRGIEASLSSVTCLMRATR